MVNKKRFSIFLTTTLLIGAVFISSTVLAEDSSTITDLQLVQIRARCSEVKSTLGRVHANDALLRVNRGQLYERLSTKLAVPLNSRIAVNRLDGNSLLTVTSKYDQDLNDFRTHYQAYEEQLSSTMKIDCVNQPAKFYDNLQIAREKRQVVYESTQKLAADIGEYKQAFTEFARSYREKKS
ncbi:MAG: exported protein of unknown function [Candidatus Saccharibacteria bacterium]|nr:exported protein of unknown function [Candidatus Saccharibacteria bacterium]